MQLGLVVGLPAVAAGSVEEDQDSWGGWAATGNTHKEVETAKVKTDEEQTREWPAAGKSKDKDNAEVSPFIKWKSANWKPTVKGRGQGNGAPVVKSNVKRKDQPTMTVKEKAKGKGKGTGYGIASGLEDPAPANKQLEELSPDAAKFASRARLDSAAQRVQSSKFQLSVIW